MFFGSNLQFEELWRALMAEMVEDGSLQEKAPPNKLIGEHK
jgi:hypothetical protein